MSVPATPPASPTPPGPTPERASIQRLRAFLLAEGGLIASLVEGGPGAGGKCGDDTAAAGGGPTESVGGGQNTARGSDRDTGFGKSGENRQAGGDGMSDPDCSGGPAQLAGAGPRAERHREAYELLIETIYEGYLLHYGNSRVAQTTDGDLALLAGDRLYALGLARLVALGDVAAVAELADTISLSALAQGAGAPELADAVWTAGARAIGWGSSDAHRRAKGLVLAGAPEAIEAMRTSATGLAASP